MPHFEAHKVFGSRRHVAIDLGYDPDNLRKSQLDIVNKTHAKAVGSDGLGAGGGSTGWHKSAGIFG